VANKLASIDRAVKKKSQNILDMHQTDFDANLEEFNDNIDELQVIC